MNFNYKETIKTDDGLYYKKIIEEIPVSSEIHNIKKGSIRKEIQEKVFDLPDSVADNAKMISLLMSVVKRIYEALPDETKDNIEDKSMIEGMIEIFDSIQTLADVQFAEEGDIMIQKIFDRQSSIGKIVSEFY